MCIYVGLNILARFDLFHYYFIYVFPFFFLFLFASVCALFMSVITFHSQILIETVKQADGCSPLGYFGQLVPKTVTVTTISILNQKVHALLPSTLYSTNK